MTEATPPPTDDVTLRERLKWLMAFRVLLVTFLLGSAVIVNVNDVESFSDPSTVAIIALIIGSYLATLAYLIGYRRNVEINRLVYPQLLGDVGLAAGLILLTGGIESIFTFLFFVSIFSGALLLGRRGAMFSASASSIGLAAIVLLQFGDFPQVAILMPEGVARNGKVPVYHAIIHLVAFFTVAALSGYLAEKLGQVGSELARRQVDLKELQALNENIIRSLSSGLVTLDMDGRIIFFNEAAEQITGLRHRDVIHKFLDEVVPEFGPVILAAPALSGKSRPRFEMRFSRGEEQELYLGISLSPLRNAASDQTGYIMIFQDVTKVKALEQKILRAEHLSAIGKLSAAIAHEIRNPLASISGSIEMLRMTLNPPEEDRQLMDIVIREVDRLNALIKDFLEYARPAQSRRREVEIVEMIDDTLRIVTQDPKFAHVHLNLQPPKMDPLSLRVDPSHLQQVLWNLLRNAAEAMPDGGEVLMTRALVHDEARQRDYFQIQIEDSGQGFKPEALRNLFEPFFTTKEAGTGLGLATCHRIVTAHDGSLEAENRAEGGARMTIRLPLDGERRETKPIVHTDTTEELLPTSIFTERMDTNDLQTVGPRAGKMVLR